MEVVGEAANGFEAVDRLTMSAQFIAKTAACQQNTEGIES
jgi:hypothetical protein